MGNFQSFKANVPDPNAINPYLEGFDENCGFNNEQEMIEAMSDPRYSSLSQDGAHWREAVGKMLAQSDFSGDGNGQPTTNEGKAAARKAQYLRDEDAAIVREYMMSLYQDPRYETSTQFRREVRQIIESRPDLHDLVVPPGPSIKKFRGQFTEADLLEVKKTIDAEKRAEREKRRQEFIEQATRDAERTYIDITGMDAGSNSDDE